MEYLNEDQFNACLELLKKERISFSWAGPQGFYDLNKSEVIMLLQGKEDEMVSGWYDISPESYRAWKVFDHRCEHLTKRKTRCKHIVWPVEIEDFVPGKNFCAIHK